MDNYCSAFCIFAFTNVKHIIMMFSVSHQVFKMLCQVWLLKGISSLLSFPGAFRDFAPRFRNIVWSSSLKPVAKNPTFFTRWILLFDIFILTLKNNAQHCYIWKSLTHRFFIVLCDGLKMLWEVWVLKLCLEILPSFPVRYYCSTFHNYAFKKT